MNSIVLPEWDFINDCYAKHESARQCICDCKVYCGLFGQEMKIFFRDTLIGYGFRENSNSEWNIEINNEWFKTACNLGNEHTEIFSETQTYLLNKKNRESNEKMGFISPRKRKKR